MSAEIVQRIERLFAGGGDRAYSGEQVSQLEHALQSAQAAERDGAADALVCAALLHDIGHLLNDQGETPTLREIDDRHQYAAVPFLRGSFDDAVIAPIRLHVDAKRYLCAVEPDYLARLSPDSVRSLRLQGGAFGAVQAQRFAALPFAADAVRLRRWDDAAKVPGRRTPPLSHYLDTVRRCLRDSGAAARAPT
ncbi:MAG TPA: HD domain-containing protein [Burkholderiaceae bacterium]|nr:HD domain-containing protein [Burkholderiaceae bacterium]